MTHQKLKKQWLEKFNELDYMNRNSQKMVAFLFQIADDIAEKAIEGVEVKEKRLDVGDYGVDSVSFPEGEVWNQDLRTGYNRAVKDITQKKKAYFKK